MMNEEAGRRPDNLLGVCAAVADLTGLPPLMLRLIVVAALFASLPITVVAYGIAAVAIRLAERPLPSLRRFHARLFASR